MQNDPLTMFCYTDLSGQVRGKGFPTRQIEKRLKDGIGWTPNNIMFTALGSIAPGFWGSHGDVMLMPDASTGVEVDFEDGTPAERFYLCDVHNTDGTPWDCCPRTLLREAAAELEAATGLTLRATFEHEFIYSGANARAADNYALEAVRRHGQFGETYLGALRTAGVEVDTYLAEFAAGQFEVTVPPMGAMEACDTAVKVREMARATAFRLGHSVSFSPRVTPDGLGSGVHIHFSLWDANGVSRSATIPRATSGLVRLRASFCRASCAICRHSAPSPRQRRSRICGWCRMLGRACGRTSATATVRRAFASARPSAPHPRPSRGSSTLSIAPQMRPRTPTFRLPSSSAPGSRASRTPCRRQSPRWTKTPRR